MSLMAHFDCRDRTAIRSSSGAKLTLPNGFANDANDPSLEGHPPSGLLVTPDYFVVSQRELIISLAADHRVAAIYPLPAFTNNGGLMSYSIDEHLEAQLAAYVDRILKGAKPAELPVQEPSKFKLMINLRTATALGLTVPPSLLIRADEVIE